MSMIHDLEHDLMKYCLKHEGKWWANHFFRNKEVNKLYEKLRSLDAGTVMCIVVDASADYQKHITLKDHIDAVGREPVEIKNPMGLTVGDLIESFLDQFEKGSLTKMECRSYLVELFEDLKKGAAK